MAPVGVDGQALREHGLRDPDVAEFRWDGQAIRRMRVGLKKVIEARALPVVGGVDSEALEADVVGEGEGVSVHADEVGDIANEAKGVSQDAIVRTGRVGKIEAQLRAAEVGGRGNSLVIL